MQWVKYLSKRNSVNLLSACFTMKEGGNDKYLGTIMIPKARIIPKYLFHVSAPKETEDMSVSLPRVGQEVYYYFFLMFSPSP